MDVQLNNGSLSVSGSGPSTPRNFSNMKVAYTVSERQGRSFWTRVGVAFTNRDGSINIRLDAVPVSGNLQLRDYTPRDAASESELPPAPLSRGSSNSSSFSLGDSSKHGADIPF
ncbi:hypothetical protein LVJ94_05000 [Pendulispora rubella]|uniref:Uncharacterized protein n=1 Tax=Pendulispora rubella TaxID=2741070 RepID=A0ABZ2L6U4_9BACT